MNVIVVGSGISGLSAALIARSNGHEVVLLEKESYFGGHAHTITVQENKMEYPVDTGFLVFNDLTYPHLIKLFKYLNVPTVTSNMSLSVTIPEINLQWGGSDLGTLFAQKKNLLNIKFLKFLWDIYRFNGSAEKNLQLTRDNPHLTLGDLLRRNHPSPQLRDWYIIPMASSIWSTPRDQILNFPAFTFLQFCINHKLLQINNRPEWKTVQGGSKVYVDKILERISQKYLSTMIHSITRSPQGVRVDTNWGPINGDILIMATHPPQAKKLITNITSTEFNILESFHYSQNTVQVHHDSTILPKYKNLWSSWNFRQSKYANVNYLINKLQPLPTTRPVIVSLNYPEKITAHLKIMEMEYEHPLFDRKAIEAQSKISSIQGIENTYYVGAWQRYGFHEDGILSAVNLAHKLNWSIPWE